MLTIAIPTYNRCKRLAGLLDEIRRQAAECRRGFVSVCVSDNASPDETGETVKSRIADFGQIGVELAYFRNSTNVGYSRNVDAVISHSTGEFALIMGDDDGLEPGALRRLQDILEQVRADVYLLGSATYSSDWKKRLSQPPEAVTEELHKDGEQYILKHKGFPPALVSGYVFRKSAWEKIRASDFHFSISIHMLAATRIMCSHGPVYETDLPFVKYRTSEGDWSSDPLYPFRFYLDELQFLKLTDSETSERVKRILNGVAMKTLAFYLVRQKVTRHKFDAELFHETYANSFYRMNIFGLATWLARRLPRWMLILPFYCLVPKHLRNAGI